MSGEFVYEYSCIGACCEHMFRVFRHWVQCSLGQPDDVAIPSLNEIVFRWLWEPSAQGGIDWEVLLLKQDEEPAQAWKMAQCEFQISRTHCGHLEAVFATGSCHPMHLGSLNGSGFSSIEPCRKGIVMCWKPDVILQGLVFNVRYPEFSELTV